MVEIQLDAYLDQLKAAEAQQRAGERRQVPTYAELANESGVSPVTLSRITNGHVKQLNLGLLASLITSLRQRGFATEVSDLLVYHTGGATVASALGEPMKPLHALAQQQLKLRQPSVRKQIYELRTDSDLVGTLHWPSAFGSSCIAETAEGSWTFHWKGFVNTRFIARIAGSEQDLLIYSLGWSGNGKMEHLDGREFVLQGPGWWNNRFTLAQKSALGEEVELLVVSMNFTFVRGSADVTLRPQLAQSKDAALLTMFSCYLAVMVQEQMASIGTA